MNEHEATEIAYKQGKIDTVRKIQEMLRAEGFIADPATNLEIVVLASDIDRAASKILEDNGMSAFGKAGFDQYHPCVPLPLSKEPNAKYQPKRSQKIKNKRKGKKRK